MAKKFQYGQNNFDNKSTCLFTFPCYNGDKQ